MLMKLIGIKKKRFDCPRFQKYFIYKYSMGIAVRIQLEKVPLEAKYELTEIGNKLPKRDRPPKASKALLVM